MTLLVIIVINSLSGILWRPSAFISTSTGIAPRGVSCISHGGRSNILRSFFSVASLLFLFLLLFCLSLFGGLSAIGALRSWGFLFLGPVLTFFDLWILYWLASSTGFGCWWRTILKAVFICVANIGARPEGGLGFGIDSFFHYFFKAIELLAALLYFDLHWRPEALPEVLNYSTFL